MSTTIDILQQEDQAFFRALMRAASLSKFTWPRSTFPLDVSSCSKMDRAGRRAFSFAIGDSDSVGSHMAISEGLNLHLCWIAPHCHQHVDWFELEVSRILSWSCYPHCLCPCLRSLSMSLSSLSWPPSRGWELLLLWFWCKLGAHSRRLPKSIALSV
jgi:hypothetical protein